MEEIEHPDVIVGVYSRIALMLGWSVIAVLLAFVINTILTNWFEWPGAQLPLISDVNTKRGSLQFALYLNCILGVIILMAVGRIDNLRSSATNLIDLNSFLIRVAFWFVLFVGLVDASVSFMRIQGMFDAFGLEGLSKSLGKSQFRAVYLHAPIFLMSIIVGYFTKTLGFIWLTLLVVAAELVIVFSRFVYSYEQPLMADLVRFWYAALFLFSSAYTLLDDAHVRVDIIYAGFKKRNKGISNAMGSILFGMVFCWTIILIGMGGKASTINGPILIFEITPSGFGMYTKYMMAGFLGVFAVTMLIQFVAMFFNAIADILSQSGNSPEMITH